MLFRTSLASALALCGRLALADHPCSEEVAAACPDRPAADLATCLKDPKEHEKETEISSGCTDFIALNGACTEDIEKFCDGAAFSDDTILCLTQWTEPESLSARCRGVISWAVPQDEAEEEEEGEEPDAGMSDQDKEEKKEWQAKRKAVRDEAINRMKLKEEDKKKEDDRVALEEYKKNDPEGYAEMVKQQEEEKRQQAEFKRMERKRAAALERQKQQAAGMDEDDKTAKKSKAAESQPMKKGKKKGSWGYTLFSFVALGFIGVVGYLAFSGSSTGSKKGGGGGKQGKKRR